MIIDLVRLDGLLLEAQHCAEAQRSSEEQAEFAEAKERYIRRTGEDAEWISEVVQEYRRQSQARGEQLAELQRDIREEVLRQERIAGSSIRAQLELVNLLETRRL